MKTTELNNNYFFKKAYPKWKNRSKEYTKILKKTSEILYDHLFKGLVFECVLGKFQIVRTKSAKLKYSKLHLNYEAYKKNNLVLKHLNEHTDGYYCKIVFTPPKIKKLYRFTPCRGLKRQLAKNIKTIPNSYKNYEISVNKYSLK